MFLIDSKFICLKIQNIAMFFLCVDGLDGIVYVPSTISVTPKDGPILMNLTALRNYTTNSYG